MKRAMALAGVLLATGVSFAGSVTWQCDMGQIITDGGFIPGVDQLVVRGNFNNWCDSSFLMTDADNNQVYTATFTVDGPYMFTYKYVINPGANCSGGWENLPDRNFNYTGGDVIMPVQCFNNACSPCDAEITFVVDMGVQIAAGAFHPENGDIVVMRGPLNGWSGTSHMLTPVGGTLYAITLQFPALSGGIEHKFVIVGNGDNWESNSNRFGFGDCYGPDTNNNGFNEAIVGPVFFGNTGWADVVDHPVLVDFRADASRASCWFANGGAPTFDGIASYDDINFIGVAGYFNGWPWGNIAPEHKLSSQGSCQWAGVSVLFPAWSASNQIIKLGLNGNDNEAAFGENHGFDLNDDNGTGLLDVNVEFGSNGTQWDCFTGCVETVEAHEQPTAFALAQNVPNPFNPMTTISFTLPETMDATLAVYDLSGAQVAVLSSGVQSAGSHSVSFDASRYASGVYVYTLQSAAGTESRKMVLVK